jgi:hypothetical protein
VRHAAKAPKFSLHMQECLYSNGPTVTWRVRRDGALARIAAGSPEPGDDWATRFSPETQISGTDAAFDDFEETLRRVDLASDDAVMDAVRAVVLSLNEVHVAHEGSADSTGFETGEREELCSYIKSCLEDVGVDVDALAARRRLTRHEITDEWRVW